MSFAQRGVAAALCLWGAALSPPAVRAQAEELLRHPRAIHALAFSPDGNRIVSGGGDGRVRIYDGTTGAEQADLAGHDGEVLTVSFSPDGRHAASGGVDRTIRVWDVADRKEVRVLRGYLGDVTSVAFSPDGKFLVSVGSGHWRAALPYLREGRHPFG